MTLVMEARLEVHVTLYTVQNKLMKKQSEIAYLPKFPNDYHL